MAAPGQMWRQTRQKELNAAASDPANPIEWDHWSGLVQRGVPSSLVLSRLTPKTSAKRAPGPGAIRKTERGPMTKKHLEGRRIILHTDAAKSFKAKVKGVLHDNVRHCKKRVKVRGKFMWQAPVYVYVRIALHKCPKTGKKCESSHRQGVEVPQGPHPRAVKLNGRVCHPQGPDSVCPV